ncbi:MAG: MerR family transcriptional regulator [Clostridiales bacterium]|jgi:DNA-binding transcriptional MerR regulator|nr:MerR family transcriptional regulator [Clostridiales bacterium]
MQSKLFSISEAASMARVTRAALLHYDKLGLLPPQARGENNYRYYTDEQISLVNFVRTLQQLEMPLRDIRKIEKMRTPEIMLALLSKQLAHIAGDIEKLRRAEKLLLTLKNTIEEAVAVDENKIEAHWAKAERIFLGPQNDYSNGRTLNHALLDFYRYCKRRDSSIDLNYSAWGVYSEERIKRGDWVWPDKFYLNMPDGPDEKPAGLYITGYDRGNYGRSDALYKRLTAFIKEHGYEICGPTYETYPLNEISVCDPNNYLMRISITVREQA